MYCPSIFRYSFIAIAVCLFIMAAGTARAGIDTAGWRQGRSDFRSYCASCHNPTIAQTGPALSGASQRWEAAGDYHGRTGTQWLHAWIRNWKDPVDSGYPYAVKIQNYSPSQMNVFPSLTDTEIDHILLYVDDPQAVSATTGDHAEGAMNWSEITLYMLVLLIAIALVVLFVLTRRNRSL